MRLEDGLSKDIGQFTYVNKEIIVSPFFTKEYCQFLIERFDEHGFEANEETRQNTYAYNVRLNEIEDGRNICLSFVEAMKSHIEAEVAKNWAPVTDSRLWSGYPIPFCTKFSKETKTSMRLHSDSSLFTFLIKLNDDFGGCNTVYPRQDWTTEKVKAGEMVILPGMLTHPHYTQPLTHGTKYTLVARHSILEYRTAQSDDIMNLV